MRIEQRADYLGDGEWAWAVWVEAPESELDAIESVEWTLHPTFSNPVQRISERNSRFRLEATGWGEFEINATARMKDGRERHLSHWLELSDPEEPQPQAVAGGERPTVLVASAAADASWGGAIERALEEQGFEVLTTDDALEPGKPWQASLGAAIDSADLMVGVFSDAHSAWVEREVKQALSADVPVVPIRIGHGARVPEWLDQIQAVSVDEHVELGSALQGLAEHLNPSS